MTGFDMDSRLRRDCSILRVSDQCSYLLHKNADVDWVILVPHCEQTEFYQLPAALQRSLVADINRVSKFIRDYCEADKINVATVGNVVSQLHIHVIGRYHDDPYWPDAVWGQPVHRTHDAKSIQSMRSQFGEFMDQTSAT